MCCGRNALLRVMDLEFCWQMRKCGTVMRGRGLEVSVAYDVVHRATERPPRAMIKVKIQISF